jgi:tRNA threonylcarbamoyl adenosine modification protein (Sua5/YciO/YrdC/YwlC family)
MRVLTKEEFEKEKDYFLLKIGQGALFIYPTDTIYGIGCNARDPSAIKRLRKLKKRGKIPFSIIAPDKRWIQKNCKLSQIAKVWLNKLPGPYTLILKLKEKNVISDRVAPGLDTIGVRIPKHWFSEYVKELQIPIITTSANVKGGEFMTSMDDIDLEIKAGVDFIIYDGKNEGKASKIVNLSTGEPEVVRE